MSETGVFWTIPIDSDQVVVNPTSGAARLVVDDLEIEDYHDVVNALKDGPSVEATVSFDVRWSAGGTHVSFRNAAANFAGDFVQNAATMRWSAESEEDFEFESDPLRSGFAVVGSDRNGAFFS